MKKRRVLALILVTSILVIACGGKNGGQKTAEQSVAAQENLTGASKVDEEAGKVTVDLGKAQLRWDNLGDAGITAEDFERFDGDVNITVHFKTNNYTDDSTHEIGLRFNWEDKTFGKNTKVSKKDDSISFDISDEQRKKIVEEGIVYIYGHNIIVKTAEITGNLISEPEGPDTLFTEENGVLRVSDGKLVNEAGSPIQLKGLANFYLSVEPQLARKSVFARMRDEWGANVLRLPVNVDTSSWGTPEKGYASGSDDDRARITATLDKAMMASKEAGMYAIVEWVVLEEKTPMAEIEYAKQFFEYVSSTYKDYTNIIYEICNEPNKGATWEEVKEYCATIIPLIRNNDPDSLILVGTPDFSSDLDAPINDPLEYDNIMYVFHEYTGHNNEFQEDIEMIDRAMEAKLPVFMTEVAGTDANQEDYYDMETIKEWMPIVEKYNISYIVWKLEKYSDFDRDDEYWNYMHEYMKNDSSF
ncbi:MAG: glycoside hydrolase family 5 protein [Butyrivibrio sp.]|nr:glycoside hydrolase family 5 protein [Butyrivibrio sp.]